MTGFWLYTGTLCVGLAMGMGILQAEEDSSFNTVRVEGKNYINLADFIRYYKFDKDWRQNGLDIILQSKYKRFRFRINSQECFLNGIRLILNDVPIESRNSILISEMDTKKTLDPLFRPWSIRKRKVRTIMIDPGHGGEDLGTKGYRGSIEKKLTLDLAQRVEKFLRQAGFRTIVTRRSDTYVSLEDRSQFANSSEADLFLSLHFNSAKPNTDAAGVETYCLTPIGLSSTGSSIRKRLGFGEFGAEPGNAFDRQNVLLAYCVQGKILKLIPGIEDRGVKRARFFVIRATELPSILVESGFLSNPAEEKLILTSSYREKLASAIVDGIKRYTDYMNPPNRD